MTSLKNDLKAVAKSLKSLTLKTERIAKRLEKLEKAQTAKKVKAKPKVKVPKRAVAKRKSKVTASETVLRLINRSRRGVDTATLKRKTGFNGKSDSCPRNSPRLFSWLL